jgi:hypothetical protein
MKEREIFLTNAIKQKVKNLKNETLDINKPVITGTKLHDTDDGAFLW